MGHWTWRGKIFIALLVDRITTDDVISVTALEPDAESAQSIPGHGVG